MIDEEETFARYGYYSTTKPANPRRKLVVICMGCMQRREVSQHSWKHYNSPKCASCVRRDSHANPNSGYNTDQYRKLRSKITTEYNKTRKVGKTAEYDRYLEDVLAGRISFLEIANKLGVHDSSVCKYFSKKGVKSRYGGKSFQEKEILVMLKNIFPIVEYQKNYAVGDRRRSDFFVPGIGHIEYDGGGFYHQLKDSDGVVDHEFQPIRLSAQAYFGREAYLRWKLLGDLTGYCAVTSPKYYSVSPMQPRLPGSRLLEQCHPLGNAPATVGFGLTCDAHLIGVAFFGLPTNPYEPTGTLELRRFFVLDGTPRNTESWFLRQCEKKLPSGTRLVSFIHAHERGCSLKACGWKEIPYRNKDYDFYLIDGKLFSKRRIFGLAKKTGLVKQLGTTKAKEVIALLLNGRKVTYPAKRKFEKQL